jgi:hypothetical protein
MGQKKAALTLHIFFFWSAAVFAALDLSLALWSAVVVAALNHSI